MVRSAREAAFYILRRVQSEGAWINRLLSSVVQRHELDEAETAFVSELCYGACRQFVKLGALWTQLAGRPFHKLEPKVQTVLVLGMYQIAHTRVPSRAAVHESVELAKRHCARAKGLVNATLRRFAEAVAEQRIESVEAALPTAARYSVPRSLWSALTQDRSTGLVEDWLSAMLERPPLDVRLHGPIERVQQSYETLVSQSELFGEVERLSTRTLRLQRGHIASHPLFVQGQLSVQDAAAQAVAELLSDIDAEQPTLLDMCAAPGTKTLALVDRYPNAKVYAADIHEHRVRLIEQNIERLGLTEQVTAFGADGTNAKNIRNKSGQSAFDAVLLDAPCSGSGTLRRHPEQRLHALKVRELVALQAALLRSAAQLVKPGGHLVYAVCSPLQQEGLHQIKSFLREHPDFQLAPITFIPAFASDAYDGDQNIDESGISIFDGMRSRFLMDGFFAARLQRKADSV